MGGMRLYKQELNATLARPKSTNEKKTSRTLLETKFSPHFQLLTNGACFR